MFSNSNGYKRGKNVKLVTVNVFLPLEARHWMSILDFANPAKDDRRVVILTNSNEGTRIKVTHLKWICHIVKLYCMLVSLISLRKQVRMMIIYSCPPSKVLSFPIVPKKKLTMPESATYISFSDNKNGNQFQYLRLALLGVGTQMT